MTKEVDGNKISRLLNKASFTNKYDYLITFPKKFVLLIYPEFVLDFEFNAICILKSNIFITFMIHE